MEEKEDAAEPEEDVLASISGKKVTAAIVAGEAGILSGVADAAAAAEEMGIRLERMLEEGSEIAEGDEIALITVAPDQIAQAEENLIGLLAKPSGVATAARVFVKTAGKKPKIVCGAWKKVPPSGREAVRRAVETGGAGLNISDRPFLYLDSNYTEMFGGIRESIAAVSHLAAERVIVVQLKGRHAGITREALEAAESGAGILFIDTGATLDFMEAAFELERAGLRKKVKIAFGGNLDLKDVRSIKKDKFGIEIIDIGAKIADAPLLDMRLEVIAVEEGVS
jgi:nicotinate-nucleotide pyrophosphorylase (carboxylating)